MGTSFIQMKKKLVHMKVAKKSRGCKKCTLDLWMVFVEVCTNQVKDEKKSHSRGWRKNYDARRETRAEHNDHCQATESFCPEQRTLTNDENVKIVRSHRINVISQLSIRIGNTRFVRAVECNVDMILNKLDHHRWATIMLIFHLVLCKRTLRARSVSIKW